MAPLTTSGIARRAPPAAPPALPNLRHLRRVVPVAQVQVLPSATLMLLSLESYSDGAVLHRRLIGSERRRNTWLEFLCGLVDDAGRR